MLFTPGRRGRIENVIIEFKVIMPKSVKLNTLSMASSPSAAPPNILDLRWRTYKVIKKVIFGPPYIFGPCYSLFELDTPRRVTPI